VTMLLLQRRLQPAVHQKTVKQQSQSKDMPSTQHTLGNAMQPPARQEALKAVQVQSLNPTASNSYCVEGADATSGSRARQVGSISASRLAIPPAL